MRALLAALAATTSVSLALCAANAVAAEFVSFTGTYPVSLSIINHTEHAFHFNSKARVECEGAALHGSLSHASSTLTVEPEYKGCLYVDGTTKAATTVKSTCSYEFSITGGSFTGEMAIVGPLGCRVLLSAASLSCEIEFPAQPHQSLVEYIVSSATMNWKLQVKGLEYKTANTTCPDVTQGFHTTGEYTATFEDKELIIR